MNNRRYLLASLAPIALILSALLVFTGESTPRVVYGQDNVPGRYIVVLNDNVDPGAAADALGEDLGFESDTVYRRAINGFAAQMSAEDAQTLAESRFVKMVAADQYVHTSIHTNPFQTIPTGVDRIDANDNFTSAIASGGPNLDVDVAVIDTGVISGHVDLNVGEGPALPCTGNTTEDGHGHGTHVAGTIAAIDDDHGVTGIAPGARVHPVKVLADNGSGTDSCVIDGIDWVTNRRQEYNDGAGDGDPGINIIAANMSLGGASTDSPDADPMCLAINTAVAAGIVFAVAAGNEGDNSANYSPAHCTNAITVSAFGDYDGQPGGLGTPTVSFPSCPPGQQTVQDDTFACFSNWGAPVDIAAPGVDILSTYPGPAPACPIVSCYAWMSGTSMATPHVTGALLILHLEGYAGPATPTDVMAALTLSGYARPQKSNCGFTGDHPDDPAEPLLYLGSDCQDGDNDGVNDAADNCPNWPNSSQALPDWPVPAGDSDCDSFPDSVAVTLKAAETTIGTDPARHCAATSVRNDESQPDAWPMDFDDNQRVNGQDLLAYNLALGQSTIGDPLFIPGLGTIRRARFDLSGNGIINGQDMLRFNAYLSKVCT